MTFRGLKKGRVISHLAAASFLAFGLFSTNVAESHTLNLKVRQVFQTVKIPNLKECERQWSNKRIQESLLCQVIIGDPGVGLVSLYELGDLKYVGNWPGGNNAFWVRTSFNVYLSRRPLRGDAPGENLRFETAGHYDARFVVSR